jgi:uncharacterized membrane protein YfcA
MGTERLLLFVLVGFVGQIIDGALGIAYGVTCSTALITMGIAPAVASASVHTAEIFTTAASGLSHWRLGNVDFKLVTRLAVPGMIGGILGAYVLTSFPGDKVVPFVSLYCCCSGSQSSGGPIGGRMSFGSRRHPGWSDWGSPAASWMQREAAVGALS